MANHRLPDQTGKRFGRLVVLSEIRGGGVRLRCLFRCDCGVEFEKSHGDVASSVKQGHAPCCPKCFSNGSAERCGNRFRTHGLTRTKLYSVHRQMHQRCYNPKSADYPGWGGRGIRVCDEWRSLHAFIAWANTHGYLAGLTIERLDNNGNYEPSNCTWIPNTEQWRNIRPRRKRESSTPSLSS